MAVRKSVIYRELANIINHGNLMDREQYLIVEEEKGVPQILLVNRENFTVKYVHKQAVRNAILRYTVENQSGAFDDLSVHDAEQAVEYWIGISPRATMPPSLVEAKYPHPTFHRLSFNYDDEIKPTPVLDEFLSRCTNADAVMQFVGSLFVENASPFQYLWLFGPGGEGKGSFGRALMNIIGASAISTPVPKTDGQKQFMAYNLRGKRLCIFPECSNFAFPNDPLFKLFTGGDYVFFEQKGKTGYSGKLNCKFIFFSNERNGVDGADANTRRMIYSEISKPTVKYSSTTYDALLAAEMPHFIKRARRLYLEKCPMGEEIEFNDATTQQLLDFNNERLEYLTQTYVILDRNESVSAMEMQSIKNEAKLTTTEYRRWIEYLRTKYGIENCLKRVDGHPVRFWKGLKGVERCVVTGLPVRNTLYTAHKNTRKTNEYI